MQRLSTYNIGYWEAFILKALMQGFRFSCCQCISCRSCAQLYPAAVVQPGRQPLLQQQPQREDRLCSRRVEGGVARLRGGSRALSSARCTGLGSTIICSNLVSLPHSVTAAAPLISAVRQQDHWDWMWQCWRDGVVLLTPPCSQPSCSVSSIKRFAVYSLNLSNFTGL